MSKNNRIASRVISMILGVLIGVALVVVGSVVKAETLVWLAFVIWGVVVVIGNIPGLIYAIANIKTKGAIFDLIASVIGILLGLGLIFSQNEIITIILAAYMIVFPVIRIVLAKSAWAEQLGREIFAVGMDILNLLLSIIGWVVIALTVILGTVAIIKIATEKEAKPADAPIYVEGEETKE